MSSSDAEFPCPVCHLSFKTEGKVSQHLDKCLASQEREERSSRTRNNNNNKRRVDDDEDDEDGDVGSLTRNNNVKRSRKEDQVAAWSGLGLQSPGDTEKNLKSKAKKSSGVGGAGGGGSVGSLSAKNPTAKKSPTSGKKNVGKKNGEDESEVGGKFGEGIGKKEAEEEENEDSSEKNSEKRKTSPSPLGWSDSEEEEEKVNRVKSDNNQTASEAFGKEEGLKKSHRNIDIDDDLKSQIAVNQEGAVDKKKKKKKSECIFEEDEEEDNEEEKKEKIKKSGPRRAKGSLNPLQKKENSSSKKCLSKVSHGANEREEDNPTPTPPARPANKSSTSEILSANAKPLAETLRPLDLNHLFGQEFENNDGEGGRPTVGGSGGQSSAFQKTDIRWLKALIDALAPIPSLIFWGPPGCGKTTLAKIIANEYAYKNKEKSLYRFVTMSACASGVADVKKQAEVAKNELKMTKRRTLLFMDEIHRFTKSQQDTFLPIIENGTIVLLGATTENPSFSLNSALLSRCKVVVLNALEPRDVRKILERGVEFLNGIVVGDEEKSTGETPSMNGVAAADSPSSTTARDKSRVNISSTALDVLSHLADGDARVALNGLQTAIQTYLSSNSPKPRVDVGAVKESLQKSHVSYDRAGDQHLEIISAFHKSIRGSDDNAALYWLTRMLKGGEDPRYIARRMIRIAAEDIGLGDPQALIQANAAHQTVLAVGMPECDVALAQAAVYLARARKSVEVYAAMKSAENHVARQMEEGMPSVPLHLRNGSTKLMREMGYGKGYLYNPDCTNGEDAFQTYMPDGCESVDYFG